ncbi:MAG TPA: acetoacetate--CoA ligase [Polyangiaceae bacterium]|nr:acetoacetate--CoA ligase [Polyangiaceae bacterium]
MQSHPASPLWEPSAERRASCRLSDYLAWLSRERRMDCEDYASVQRWSVEHSEEFWRSLVDYFAVQLHSPARAVLSGQAMPNAHWFEGASLNYVERALQHPNDDLALIARHEDGTRQALSYGELRQRVANVAQGFRDLGVQRGDRVVGYLCNDASAVVAFLACASLGAIWSSCPPEFGVESVLDRWQQISPKLLVAVCEYRYGGKRFARTDAVRRIVAGLPSLVATVSVGNGDGLGIDSLSFETLSQGRAVLQCEVVPFEHPLWILYSSGTTGLPKALVHGHGGILLEHLKALALHGDIGQGDRFFWFSTTGWMMWNYLVSGLLVGATIMLYDGNPGHPDLNALWRIADEEQITHFGVSAAYLLACRKAALEPGKQFALSALRNVGSTGSPLPVEGFTWVYENVKRDVLLGSISGGTDLCTAFVGQCPLLPVYAGEIQCRSLGAAVNAWNELGETVEDQVGELVITQPMPSMPLYFWGDPEGSKYRSSYFEMFPGIWRHGDWITFNERGGCVISGRSDSTLNRGGVRIGTSELYRVVEGIAEVVDSLAVDTSELGKEGKLWLFVVLRANCALDDALKTQIGRALREKISPRHVPDEILQIDQVPRTLSGKKLEVPIKRILAGVPLEKAVNPGTLQDPAALHGLLDQIRAYPAV